MNNEKPDYSLFTSDDDWSLTDAEFIVGSYNRYLLSSQGISDFSAVDAYTRKLIQSTNAFTDTDKFISYQPIDEDGHPEYDCNSNKVWLTDCDRTKVNIKNFIKWAYRERIPLPDEIMNIIKAKVSKSDTLPATEATVLPKKETAALADLPLLRKQVSELSAEKIKWDASIEAAARVGLLFYEKGLEKPVRKDAFIKEFTEHLGSGLHDSTIEKIYKALPEVYKLKGGRPKKDAATVNIDNIIKVAAYVGTLHEAPERLKLSDLKVELKEADIEVPDDATLKKIIEAVKDLDI